MALETGDVPNNRRQESGVNRVRTQLESYEDRIGYEKNVRPAESLSYDPALDAADLRPVFYIGEDSEVYGGKIDSFSKGITEAMFHKPYGNLNVRQRQFVDQLVYYIGKEYGIDMHVMKPGDTFEFDFSDSTPPHRFSYYQNNNTVLSNVPLSLSTHHEAVKKVHAQLGTLRMNAEAQSALSLTNRKIMDLATEKLGLVGVMERMVQDISLESRKEALRNPIGDEIDGINAGIRYYLQHHPSKKLTGEALERAFAQNKIGDHGEAYRGTAAQNAGWVLYIRDRLGYDAPFGETLEWDGKAEEETPEEAAAAAVEAQAEDDDFEHFELGDTHISVEDSEEPEKIAPEVIEGVEVNPRPKHIELETRELRALDGWSQEVQYILKDAKQLRARIEAAKRAEDQAALQQLKDEVTALYSRVDTYNKRLGVFESSLSEGARLGLSKPMSELRAQLDEAERYVRGIDLIVTEALLDR